MVLVMFFRQVVEEGGCGTSSKGPCPSLYAPVIAAFRSRRGANPRTKDHFADVPFPAGRGFALDGSHGPGRFAAPRRLRLVEIAPGHRMNLVPSRLGQFQKTCAAVSVRIAGKPG